MAKTPKASQGHIDVIFAPSMLARTSQGRWRWRSGAGLGAAMAVSRLGMRRRRTLRASPETAIRHALLFNASSQSCLARLLTTAAAISSLPLWR